MDAEMLRAVLDYSEETGIFRWKVATSKRVRPGSVAGYIDPTGYRTIRVFGTLYKAHRLAWLYVKGEWPEFEIDHMNRQKGDNRFSNLRDVPHRSNCQNIYEPFAHGSSGALGMHRSGHRFAAKITVGGKSIWLGRHATPDAASAAYHAAKRRLHDGVA